MTFDHEHGARTVRWLRDHVVRDARGDDIATSETRPDGRFWLGRLAPERTVMERSGERGQRMEPCAAGLRVQPVGPGPWTLSIEAGFVVWEKTDTDQWKKSGRCEIDEVVKISSADDIKNFGEAKFAAALRRVSLKAMQSARIDVEVEHRGDRPVLAVTVVNTTDPMAKPEELYEVRLRVKLDQTEPFQLEGLADSFRYSRDVPAEGIAGGADASADGWFETTDWVEAARPRPGYDLGPDIDLRFDALSKDPVAPLERLMARALEWGEQRWSSDALEARAAVEGWTTAMQEEAADAARAFDGELKQMERGLALLRSDDDIRRAFSLMNEAMAHSAAGKYDAWRPFQLGFQLVCLPSLIEGDEDRRTVDTLWFATGGGKTETYLGVVVTACLFDRIRGKEGGVTAWSRFPLRMLSLQQMQRFADVLAGAELVRRREQLGGAVFRLGFLVGAAGSPNRVRESPGEREFAEDSTDETMPGRFKRLERCPFCRSPKIEMAFNERHWTLDHRCTAEDCPWPAEALPVHVVDEEVFRFLPSVVVGTLDKAAGVGYQANFRGLVSAPLGECSGPMHGYTYATRYDRPLGCLVPGCSSKHQSVKPLRQGKQLFPPTIRVQDELHLLRDSLGAVDSQYETLLDHLAQTDDASAAKIIASSATLNGHDRQVDALYARKGRVFPQPGPRAGDSFWSWPTENLLRHFVGLAPRGQTLEYANDRMTLVVQQQIRRLVDPASRRDAAAEIGIPVPAVDAVVDIYGTQVVYGSRLRDVEAVARSFGSEVPIDDLHHVTLTGGTPFDEVREALERLSVPEPRFEDRLHLVAASSMMSHGVDIDRLNVITMLGLPLTTAEFIQTTARIGRTYPGLVFVLHRMGGERDASVYRSFPTWVTHGDRFVEPVPITRRSRKVLEIAFPGAFMARVLAIHEPRAMANRTSLTRASKLAKWFDEQGIGKQDEYEALLDALAIDPARDPNLADDLREMVEQVFYELEAPGDRFTGDIFRYPVMLSLRDVEDQAPIEEANTKKAWGRR